MENKIWLISRLDQTKSLAKELTKKNILLRWDTFIFFKRSVSLSLS